MNDDDIDKVDVFKEVEKKGYLDAESITAGNSSIIDAIDCPYCGFVQYKMECDIVAEQLVCCVCGESVGEIEF